MYDQDFSAQLPTKEKRKSMMKSNVVLDRQIRDIGMLDLVRKHLTAAQLSLQDPRLLHLLEKDDQVE